MAFSELERKRHERDIAKFMQRRRPPPEIRPKLDLGFRIEGQSVELFEIRPRLAGQQQDDGGPCREGHLRSITELLEDLLDAQGSQVARL